MEHSYVGNDHCNDILSLLSDEWKGDRVIDIGDYATSDDGTTTQEFISKLHEEFNDVTSFYFYGELFEDVEPNKENRKIRYVYNLDKKEYLDLYHQPIVDFTHDKKDALFVKINSFALLTACGNGQGGGDFRGCNEEEVGKWAGDHFVTSEKKLEKYKDFKEYNNVFYEKIQYGVNLYSPYEFTTYDGYDKKEVKKGIDCIDRAIKILKKYEMMPEHLDVYTYNLTENEMNELSSRKIKEIKYKEKIEKKQNKSKDELCI